MPPTRRSSRIAALPESAHPHPPATTSTLTASTTSKKRKSVTFDQPPVPSDSLNSPAHASSNAAQGPAPAQASSSGVTRSGRPRRSSTSATASTPSSSSHPAHLPTSTSTAPTPSAKSLGKRRAVSASPPPPPPPPTTAGKNKRRKLSAASVTKPAPTPAPPVVPAPAPASNTEKKKGIMPRKGSRASRAAKAKEKALQDDQDEAHELAIGMAAGPSDALGEKSGDVEMVDQENEDGEDGENRMLSDGEDSEDDPSGDEEENSEDDDDDEDDSEGDDDGEGVDEDDVDEDFLDHDGYGTGSHDEDDDISPPHRYSVDQDAERERDREAVEAALEAAASGLAGGAFGGFRALQGLMSGMSGRLKSILATLKDRSGTAEQKLEALQELTEVLSVSTEDTLSGYFQVESFVKEIVYILRGDNNPSSATGGGGGGMTKEEMLAFGLDPSEMMGGGSEADEESNVKMMLLACRCLANLMEALPGSAHSVVYGGAVPVLCAKLMEIQYIDLAEQTLSTLEKISEEVPHAIVREGGLSAILSFLDFFSFHVQRTAVTAAANCCRSLSPDSFDLVKEVTPIFKNILGYPDQRVVEQAALAVVRITDSYRHYPEKLESILSEDLLASVKLLLNPDSTSVGTGTYTQCLKMLSTAARASPNVAMQLVELGVAETANQILTGVGSPDWTEGEFNVQKKGGEEAIVMQNLVQRPKEQIQEALNLVCELLPGLPRDGIFDAKAFSPKERKLHSSTSTPAPVIKREELTPDLSAPAPAPAPSSSATKPEVPFPEPEVKMEVADDAAIAPTPVSAPASTSSRTRSRDHRDAVNEKRLELYSGGDDKRKLVVKRFYALLLPTLVDVYSASVNSGVRTKAVLGLLKITQLCDEESLASILKSVSMASFLAAILSSRDQSGLVTNALQLVELLLIKMPDAYQYFFRREGVMHEIERIAASPLVYVSKSKRLAASTVTSTAAPSDASAGAPADAVTVPPPTTLSSSEAQAQDMITLRARYLRDRYGAADSEPALEAKSALDNIRVLVKQLEGVEVEGLVEKMAALFADEKTPLSSFEMLESGLVDGLLRFATETRDDGPSVSQRQELLAKAFMPQLDGAATTPAFAVLVKRLQESLSRMEEFEVTLAASSSSDVDPRRSAPSMLARQLKLRLIAEEGSDVPRSCTNIVVSIHAIATFQAFNDYLRPRILAATSSSDRASGSRSAVGAGTLSSFLAAFAAANGVSPPPESGEQSTSATKASLTLEDAVASTSTAGPSNPPLTRRRSSRLSGKGADGASSSKATLDDEEADHAEENPSNPDEDQPMPAEDDEVFAGEDHDDEDEGDIEEDDELFATDFDAAPQSRDERTVHLEVNDDKLVAKTPDGTRVGTPTLGKSASTSKLAPPAPKPRASSYAAAVKSEPTDFHLEFSIGGKPVALDTTVYGAVHKHDAAQPDRRGSLWHQVYTVNFRKVAGPARPDSERSSPLPQSRDDSMPTILPSSIPSDSQQAKILQLLWVLHSINSEYGDTPESQTGPAPGLPESAFTNNKLTAKLNRQLEEPMIVASACLPDWATDLPQYFPFLFPFDTRHIFLQSTAFGYARLMQKWVGQARIDSSRRDDNLGFLGRLQRQKVRISRDRMLESAFKVFELYGSSRASLEVEFFGEVGSGLGPTLEFYALVSKEFARKDLSLWRDTDAAGPSSYVFSPAGLFPRPLDDATAEAGKKVLKVFRVLGQFVAKALMDSRIIDVHFSKAFMKMVLEYELPLKASTVMNVDKELGRSLSHLREYLVSKAAIEDDDSISGGSKKDAIDRIEIKGATVSDLTLDFTLPGYDIELKAGGRDIAVDMWNLEEYISLVIDWTLRKGVMLQVKEFKSGFSSVFPVRDLQSFTASELVMMTGALDEDWSVEGLTNAAKADHGFTMDSRPVRDLLSIMSELTIAERREFLSFITGSPRLPIGGFPALSPSLTVVRKDGGDGSLPSVMTCVNYIKLPDYSSREIVKERVMTAVKEGAGGFHLS